MQSAWPCCRQGTVLSACAEAGVGSPLRGATRSGGISGVLSGSAPLRSHFRESALKAAGTYDGRAEVWCCADKSPDNGRPAEAEAAANGRPADERRALEPCPQQGVARISPEKSDVRRILEDMQRRVLHGCVIVFSRVCPGRSVDRRCHSCCSATLWASLLLSCQALNNRLSWRWHGVAEAPNSPSSCTGTHVINPQQLVLPVVAEQHPHTRRCSA